MTYPTICYKIITGDIMIELTELRHAYPEPGRFYIDRKDGHKNYTFLHFFNSMKLLYKGELIETAPGAVIIYDIGTPQYFESQSDIVHDWIHFKGDITSLLNCTNLKLDTIYYPKNTSFITAITKELETEFYGNYAHKEILLRLKFEELIIKLSREISGESVPRFDREIKDKFRYLRGKMLSSLDEKWTSERMAKEVGFSQSRFFNIYKSIYGISPMADLINARINRAKNILSFEKKSVEEISQLLGYENTTHFIRQFKSRTGFSPAVYRQNKNENRGS